MKALVVSTGKTGLGVLRALKQQAPKGRTLRLDFVDGPAAVPKKVQAGNFDLVLLDMTVPEFRRAAMVSEIKTGSAEVPLVLLTPRVLRRKAGEALDDGLFRHFLPELHDPRSGRLDAKRLAKYLEVPVSTLAAALGKKTAAVHKSPDAASLQGGMAPLARALSILSERLGPAREVRAWLNHPHPDLGDRTPMSVVLSGKSEVLADMLRAAVAGQPS